MDHPGHQGTVQGRTREHGVVMLAITGLSSAEGSGKLGGSAGVIPAHQTRNRRSRIGREKSMEAPEKHDRFTAPWLLASALLLFALALFEKGLNVLGMSIPLTTVYPRQLLDWAVTLLIFDIALSLRQLSE